ncbi:hypothetical protein PMAYCL1PPCAC_20963, partial [Pristionchus mayeri]
TLAAFAMFAIAISAHFRRESIAWILCIGFILKATEYAPFSTDQYVYYVEFNMYLYGAIKTLNVCISLCRNGKMQLSSECLSIAYYMTYLPYSTHIIVLYEEFIEQIGKRAKKDKNA